MDFSDIRHVQNSVADYDSEGSSESVLSEDSEDDFELPEPTTLTSIRNAIAATSYTKYLSDFDAEVQGNTVVFASLPAHVIDEGNRAQLLAMGLEREDEAMQHQNDLEHIDLLRKRRLFELQKRRAEQVAQARRQIRDIQIKSTLTEELLGTFFDHSKQNLHIHLTTRTAEVLQTVGEVRRFERTDYDPNKPDWTKFEQQVEMKVVMIRGLKDKVPHGKYIVLVSKWDKLGGTPMRWSNTNQFSLQQWAPCPIHAEETNQNVRAACEVCQGWCGSTIPVVHTGTQRAFETTLDSRIFTFFPSQRTIRPYMALLFELVLLPPPGKQDRPKIVGWAALPCIDANFAIINGKFRFPMLRGDYQPSFLHHEMIMDSISEDIENWLANIYIDIFPHPREHFGRHEFQLHQEFTSHLLCLDDYPSTQEGEGWPVDSKKRGLSFDLANEKDIELQSERQQQLNDQDQAFNNRKSTLAANGVIDDANYFPYLRPAVVKDFETPALTRWGIIRDAVMDRRRFRVQEQQRSQREAIRRAEEQKKFRFSIHPHGAVLMNSVWGTQVEYCLRAILDELSLREPFSWKFWLNMLVIVASLLFQIFMRDCFVIAGFLMFSVPIERIEFKIYGMITYASYQNTTALQEVFFCFFNMFANFLLLLMQIGFGLAVKKSAGQIPENLSKFVFAMGWTYYFIPVVGVIIDEGAGLVHGDLHRLMRYFDYHQYGLYFGLFTFFVAYFFFSACVFVFVFLYTMRLHLNGILQDAYWRILLVDEDNFFFPADLEISQREFYHCLSRAERWRGANGKRRKVAVYDLITTDPNYPKFEQKNQYIAIYELNTEDPENYLEMKPMRLFRHFFFTHEGAIIEAMLDEIPTGVMAVMLQLQKSLLRAFSKKGGSNDVMGMALGKNLKEVDLAEDDILGLPKSKPATTGFNPFADAAPSAAPAASGAAAPKRVGFGFNKAPAAGYAEM